MKGLEVFEGKACGMCHTLRGTRARGTIGPDLTHVGSHLGIGALSFPNNHGYLACWSTRAQSLKPGAEMPNLTDLGGEELDALVAYLAGLQRGSSNDISIIDPDAGRVVAHIPAGSSPWGVAVDL